MDVGRVGVLGEELDKRVLVLGSGLAEMDVGDDFDGEALYIEDVGGSQRDVTAIRKGRHGRALPGLRMRLLRYSPKN